MRERDEHDFGRPRQVIQNCTQGISLEAAALLPSYTASQQTIKRKRKLVQEPHQTPRTVNDIVISQDQQITMRNTPFLLWDSGALDPHRIFMFGTNDNLNTLQTHSYWFVDGTFKVAPELFMQLFTIHGLIDNRALPLIYVLLTDKTEASYFRVFDKLKNLMPVLNPVNVRF